MTLLLPAHLPTSLNCVHVGDSLAVLRTLPSNFVHTIVTSVPYYGLRDYGTAQWEGGDVNCQHSHQNHPPDSKNPGVFSSGVRPGADNPHCRKCGAKRIDSQIGLEHSMYTYLDNLVDVFREVRRVLREDGTLWLNVGDSCSAAGKWGGNSGIKNETSKSGGYSRSKRASDLKPKDRMMIPARLAIALCDDGWYLRDEIVWEKPNPLPESMKDRTTKSHEMVYLLAKSPHYYYDIDAIREPYAEATEPRSLRGVSDSHKWTDGADGQSAHTMSQPRPNRSKYAVTGNTGGNGTSFQGHSGNYDAEGNSLLHPMGRNKRSVWTADDPLMKLRDDLSPEKRAYVISELLRRGGL